MRATQQEHDERTPQRRAAIHKYSGSLTGVYGNGYLKTLLEEWTE